MLLGQFNPMVFFLSHYQFQKNKKLNEETDHISLIIRDTFFNLLFSYLATNIQVFFLPLVSKVRGISEPSMLLFLLMFIFSGYNIVLNRVSFLSLFILRWLWRGTWIAISKALQSGDDHLPSFCLSHCVVQSSPLPK